MSRPEQHGSQASAVAMWCRYVQKLWLIPCAAPVACCTRRYSSKAPSNSSRDSPVRRSVPVYVKVVPVRAVCCVVKCFLALLLYRVYSFYSTLAPSAKPARERRRRCAPPAARASTLVPSTMQNSRFTIHDSNFGAFAVTSPVPPCAQDPTQRGRKRSKHVAHALIHTYAVLLSTGQPSLSFSSTLFQLRATVFSDHLQASYGFGRLRSGRVAFTAFGALLLFFHDSRFTIRIRESKIEFEPWVERAHASRFTIRIRESKIELEPWVERRVCTI